MSMAEAAEARPASIQQENLTKIRRALDENVQELKHILPPHIPVARFTRVVNTAIHTNPKLLLAAPRDLFAECMKAASDGLLPDGREGALVPCKDWKASKAAKRDIFTVQWMPMVFGILKKIRNSGEVSTIVARVVYAGDRFRNWIDDAGEHIEYEAGDDQDRDLMLKVFAMAKLKDGSIEVEVLMPADVEKIRAVSKAKDDGPWVDWFDEMAKKSAIRRLGKRLPMSTDADDLIRRDDALYDFSGAADANVPHVSAAPRTLSARLDALAGPSEPTHDPETGEITQDESETDAGESDPSSQAAGAEAGERNSAGTALVADQTRSIEDALLEEAREHVKEGKRALDRWYNGLSADNLDRINPHMPALWKAAKAVDEAPKSVGAQVDREALLAEARTQSLDGRKAFGAWFQALPSDQQEMLQGHMRALLDAAGKADGRA